MVAILAVVAGLDCRFPKVSNNAFTSLSIPKVNQEVTEIVVRLNPE